MVQSLDISIMGASGLTGTKESEFGFRCISRCAIEGDAHRNWVIVSPSDRLRLAAITSAPSSPQKYVWRARIVLLSADGTGTSTIMSATGKPATCVWRWQERFMVAGVVGLLREKTRPPGRHPRWTFHFIPTSSSWLNAVEGFFAKLTRRRLKHGVFRSVDDLKTAIDRFIELHNEADAKPFK